MTTNEYMELFSKTDAEYDTVEEKNYQLVHKMMEILPAISDEQLEQIKVEITNKYPYKQYSSFLEYVCLASKTDSAVADISDESATPLDSRSYTNIIDFYNDYDENLIRYIKGHLFIEFAINTILEKAAQKTASKCTFSKKIDLLFDGNFINESEKNLLKRINYFRNRIAHRLDYTLTFDTVFELVELSAKAGVDYSEETIFRNKKLSEEWYGITGILNELFPNTFCHLLYRNEQYFEDNEIMKYMC